MKPPSGQRGSARCVYSGDSGIDVIRGGCRGVENWIGGSIGLVECVMSKDELLSDNRVEDDQKVSASLPKRS